MYTLGIVGLAAAGIIFAEWATWWRDRRRARRQDPAMQAAVAETDREFDEALRTGTLSRLEERRDATENGL